MSNENVGELTHRVPVATAARYLGRSPRWVQREIRAGRLPAIDCSQPGSARPLWAIALLDLRARVAAAELQAELRIRENRQATELEKSDMCDS